MGYFGLTNFVYQVTLWIARLFYLNVLWVLFTILGLVLLGFFPASAATFSLIRLWIQGRSTPIFQKFWSEYKQSFLRANGLGWPLVPIYLFAVVLLRWSLVNDSSFSLIVMLLVTISIMIASFYTIYLFPVFTHYNVGVKDILKYTFFITAAYPHYAFGMLLTWVLISVVFLYTGFLVFFFASLSALILMYGAHITFNSIERKQLKEQI
ncbi:YesL family protein [Aquibacillus sediminis]|uniref:YesL family protein n=1 Tax=Aquibacillus sediminis TaxID=2574734 RepID=UPI001107AEAB|nr:DUF624 domain-containing protein [Aquibacillus sediminis]